MITVRFTWHSAPTHFLSVAVSFIVFTLIPFKLNKEVIFTQDKPTLFALVIDVWIKLKILEKKMDKFHGSIAVVTGASSGIGLGIVKKLLETKQLEVVGLSRREMNLTETNFRNLFKIYNHIHITCNLSHSESLTLPLSLSSSPNTASRDFLTTFDPISALFWQFHT